ncbi:Rieske (2Fe-2S) protein [Sphingobacterium sp. 2149]|uniref:Rieske (2Fe-2S) protein n=1 Tax=Sphingobacterium sp. 2149 TaxID=2817763 RepID=UPI001AEB4F3E|nr:Rieske (2Fe-2S) protein [Sphingobacterium sp. 2149]MDR6733655.1 nitrite reductase/ring-hydroxylating ferredoxin subunit [Sphingobacterium sp. 2149]
MVHWYKIERAEILKKHGISEHKFGGKIICITWFENQIYAFSRKCPHAGAMLKNGWCERGKIICPFHRHEFDLATGKGNPEQHNFIHVYPIKMEDNEYFVGLEIGFWKGLFT